MTGQLGISKSHSSIGLAHHFFPEFTEKQITFLGSDFMDELMYLGELRKPWGSTWLDFDDANVGMGHKDFMNIINRTVAKFVQMARFYGGVNSIWNLPLKKLFESNIMAVATVWIRVVSKDSKNTWAWANVHEIKPNEFSSSPPYHFPKVGTLKFRNPSNDPHWPEGKEIVERYEEKKMAFFKRYFSSELLRQQEQEAIQKTKPKMRVEDYRDYVLGHLDEFKNDKGELSFSKIMAGPTGSWLLSSGTAGRVKSAVDATLLKS